MWLLETEVFEESSWQKSNFMEDYSKQRNKPSTQRGYQGVVERCIIPIMGRMKVQDVNRPDVAALMKKLAHKPAEANRTFGVLRKMFNLAEVWGLRPDGTNPCRHVLMFPPGKETRLIVDGELVRIFRHLTHLEAEGLENYVIPLAIRLQFEFAARRSEICPLEWEWIDLEKRRVVWPDSKTGGIFKPKCPEPKVETTRVLSLGDTDRPRMGTRLEADAA